MNRTLAYLLGPELVWLLMLGITGLIIWFHQPLLSDNDNEKLLSFGWFLPGIGVLLAFSPLLWAPGSQWWWLVRIGFVSCFGIYWVVSYICNSTSHGDNMDSGVGTAAFLFASLGWMLLLGLVVVVAFASIVKWPLSTVYKWMSIVVGTLLLFGILIAWMTIREMNKTS